MADLVAEMGQKRPIRFVHEIRLRSRSTSSASATLIVMMPPDGPSVRARLRPSIGEKIEREPGRMIRGLAHQGRPRFCRHKASVAWRFRVCASVVCFPVVQVRNGAVNRQDQQRSPVSAEETVQLQMSCSL